MSPISPTTSARQSVPGTKPAQNERADTTTQTNRNMNTNHFSIDGFSLTAEQVVQAARDPSVKVDLAPSSRAALKESRDYIESTWMHDEAPLMYSFNTGVGLLKDTRIEIEHIALFQTQLIKAHAAGMGEPFPEEVSRATMLLRANAFASNYSAPRVEVVDRLLAFLNAGIH